MYSIRKTSFLHLQLLLIMFLYCIHVYIHKNAWPGARNRKGASSNPSKSSRRFFFPTVNFVRWLLFRVRSTPVLLQWHVEDPSHSAKSADGRLNLNMHTPLTHQSRSGLTMLLPKQSVGIYQETSSRATRQGTLSLNRLSSLSHCGLILA